MAINHDRIRLDVSQRIAILIGWKRMESPETSLNEEQQKTIWINRGGYEYASLPDAYEEEWFVNLGIEALDFYQSNIYKFLIKSQGENPSVKSKALALYNSIK